MRITDKGPVQPAANVRSVSGVSAPGKAEAVSPTPARTVGEVATFLGIPEAELTPSVREGLSRLMAEVDRLRQDSEEKDRRISYLERLADEDPLMPILNRRAFVRELSRMMAFTDRYGGVSSVLFFDVDGMKTINDSHTHAAGDEALAVADVVVLGIPRRGVVLERDDVIIVAIDDQSINKFGRWPWHRDRLAELIEKALVVQKKRKATKPGRSVKEKRLGLKKAHSVKKKLRRRVTDIGD